MSRIAVRAAMALPLPGPRRASHASAYHGAMTTMPELAAADVIEIAHRLLAATRAPRLIRRLGEGPSASRAPGGSPLKGFIN